MSYVIAAYGIVLACLTGYALSLWRERARLERDARGGDRGNGR